MFVVPMQLVKRLLFFLPVPFSCWPNAKRFAQMWCHRQSWYFQSWSLLKRSHCCPALLVPHSQQSVISPVPLGYSAFGWRILDLSGGDAPNIHQVLLVTAVFEDGLLDFATSPYLAPVCVFFPPHPIVCIEAWWVVDKVKEQMLHN